MEIFFVLLPEMLNLLLKVDGSSVMGYPNRFQIMYCVMPWKLMLMDR